MPTVPATLSWGIVSHVDSSRGGGWGYPVIPTVLFTLFEGVPYHADSPSFVMKSPLSW